ncbi:uncharacterized protein RAG0_02037 [Rhynchosporium agropyri]|uniref:Uncharacterized protein n=1 Tax=Rhynchosporium agropyri TaxID=914238 RepID=A0A1E1K0J1_9HELO|nr:uncharacterized protein RAG0_02037 [Rhynchosporium agropyri]
MPWFLCAQFAASAAGGVEDQDRLKNVLLLDHTSSSTTSAFTSRACGRSFPFPSLPFPAEALLHVADLARWFFVAGRADDPGPGPIDRWMGDGGFLLHAVSLAFMGLGFGDGWMDGFREDERELRIMR